MHINRWVNYEINTKYVYSNGKSSILFKKFTLQLDLKLDINGSNNQKLNQVHQTIIGLLGPDTKGAQTQQRAPTLNKLCSS